VSDQRIREQQGKRQQTPTGGAKAPDGSVRSSDPDEPVPGSALSDDSVTSSSAGAGNGRLRGVLAAIALAAVLGAAYMGFGGGGGLMGDQVSESEIQNQEAAYQTLLAGAPLPLTYVAPKDIDKAIEDMPKSVSTEQREQLRTEIKQGRTKLAWITLWDTHAEDGDILRFESSSSIPVEVTALNSKTTIAIPYPSDGKVLVTGVYDGGGGITIALESGATQIAWPTMQPGDTLKLPVTPSL
jgi:hypothetical protein